MSGLTEEGYIKKTYAEIKSDIDAFLQQKFSDVSEQSAVGQVSYAVTPLISELEEDIEDVYNGYNIYGAEEARLDIKCGEKGVYRKQATKSYGYLAAEIDRSANPQILLGTGLQCSGATNDVTYDYITIGYGNIHPTIKVEQDIYLQITEAVVGEEYTFTLVSQTGGVNISVPITAGGQAVSEIIDSIISEAITDPTYNTYVVVVSKVSSNTIRIRSVYNNTFTSDLKIGVSDYNYTKKYFAISYDAVTPGIIPVGLNCITSFNSTPTNILGVTTIETGSLGKDTEKDTELRTRYLLSLEVNSRGTIGAIVAGVRSIDGVNFVTYEENKTASEVVGAITLPPHSYHIIVDAPQTSEMSVKIAEMIAEKRPVGIQNLGNWVQTVKNPAGLSEQVNFSYVTKLYAYVRITGLVIDADFEGIFDEDTAHDKVKTNLVEYINGLGIGVDLNPKKLYSPIFNNTGYANCTKVEIAMVQSLISPPTYIEFIYPVSKLFYANITTDRITIL